MALTECRECGEQVSKSAKTCPSCGVAYPANKMAALGKGMQGCGCLLTLLVTIPILVGFCVAVAG